MSEQVRSNEGHPDKGIGMMVQGGMVYVHFFATQQTLELTAAQADDMAINLAGLAKAAQTEVDNVEAAVRTGG